MSSASLSSAIATQGFHFTLSTTVHVENWDVYEQCSLHVLYDLDAYVYADQYELAQRPGFISSLWGTSDLERPVFAVDPDGSVLLLTADPSQLVAGQAANITLDVPLHARYGNPAADAEAAYHKVTLKRPMGFFACPSDGVAPASQSLQPYASLPGWPSLPLSLIRDDFPEEHLEVVVPVGILGDLAWVDVGTAVVMITMFFYLLVASIRTATRLSSKSPSKTD